MTQLLRGANKDLGGFGVARILPHSERRTVGPFVFLDHIGPADFPPGEGIDVRVHPHIGLATVTYLFEGRIRHRDSLGTEIDIGPGAVNWMTAGRGISHSERTPPEERAAGHRLHGMQSWVALPKRHEEMAPAFAHHPADTLPRMEEDGVAMVLIAGTAFGARAPADFPHPIFYVEARADRGSRGRLPEDHAERALFLMSGRVTLAGGQAVAPGELAVLEPGDDGGWTAEETSHLMLLGGAPLDGARTLWWNLVASDPELIERAKADWRADPFGPRWGTVPGEREFIPLPD